MRSILESRCLRVGLVLMVVGTGPLLVSVALGWARGDANPNPVLPGILAMFLFWPALILILVGLADGIANRRGTGGQAN